MAAVTTLGLIASILYIVGFACMLYGLLPRRPVSEYEKKRKDREMQFDMGCNTPDLQLNTYDNRAGTIEELMAYFNGPEIANGREMSGDSETAAEAYVRGQLKQIAQNETGTGRVFLFFWSDDRKSQVIETIWVKILEPKGVTA